MKAGYYVWHPQYGRGLINRIIPAQVYGVTYHRITWDPMHIRYTPSANNCLLTTKDLTPKERNSK